MMQIPYFSFQYMHERIRHEILDAFEKFYNSSVYVSGPRVAEFESEYASFSGSQYCAGISNGLDALFLSLKILGIGEGDEVIIPSNTYIATALAVSYAGATPVLVEPIIETCNIDPLKIENSITRKTKAI